jgi:hypothetical protein
MDQTTNQHPKGKFYAFENDRKRVGDSRPQFIDGEIEIPGTDLKFELPAIFSKGGFVDGKPVIERMYGYTAPYPKNTPIRERVAIKAARANEKAKVAFENDKGPYMLEPGQYVFFPNPKAGTPGPNGGTHTDLFGYFNPGGDMPVFKLGAWLGEKDGKGYINGEIQVPLPGKDDGVIPDADPTETLGYQANSVEHAADAEPQRSGRRGRARSEDADMAR